jgi:SAM-dependent methyltransferase
MLKLLKNIIKSTPLISKLAISINKSIKNKINTDGDKNFKSRSYWESRYLKNGNSGAGSYNHFAKFKAEVINNFVFKKNVTSVIELGCGDGNQLKLSKYKHYLGFDVSPKSLEICKELFADDKTKEFRLMDSYTTEVRQLSLSLDVIYHLVEDDVFHGYMKTLFTAAERYVIIYSSNTDDQYPTSAVHVRHRNFSDWIEVNCSNWKLIKYIPNKYPYNGDSNSTSFADFYFYGRDDK